MKKKLFLLVIIMICCVGCANIKNYSYDDIVNLIAEKPKGANTYQKGYSYFIPKGLSLANSKVSFAIIESDKTNYYVYFDLISYINKKEITTPKKENPLYEKKINYNNKIGYVSVVLAENDKYLIEIMYNYAKIEVMVDSKNVNKALINSVTILNSVKYDDAVIKKMLIDDNLTYTEEVFDMFKKTKSSSDYLDYIQGSNEDAEDDVIKDTDYIN